MSRIDKLSPGNGMGWDGMGWEKGCMNILHICGCEGKGGGKWGGEGKGDVSFETTILTSIHYFPERIGSIDLLSSKPRETLPRNATYYGFPRTWARNVA